MGASSIWHTALARKIWANATSLGEALPPNKQGGGKRKASQHGSFADGYAERGIAEETSW